ncbi:hypothetical protein [Halopelagius longus]|uniref:DUF7967 domain-containing protein n=1 Tax=Halopelagius longus TaxID=1236180 RepID=A0A1H1ESQ9_9EURY|nr:hypothetical protein [Halopelagius longus]RDI71854.1 hypothetical protein DWB78_09030 [Halopelagius longus]SDQ91156.1 hypothetical protein SAMN05216278_3023 [Halopelagius longus]
MTDADADDAVRAWLVDRTYDDRGLIILVYATPDGERARRKEMAATVMHQRGISATAAVDVDPEDLDEVTDAETRDRYAAEATRMREQHDPDDEV